MSTDCGFFAPFPAFLPFGVFRAFALAPAGDLVSDFEALFLLDLEVLEDLLPLCPPVSSICLSLLPRGFLSFTVRFGFLPLCDYSAAGDDEVAVLAPPVLPAETYALP